MNELLDAPAQSIANAAPSARSRDASIDLLRGLVMVIMVLDHARDFFFGIRVSPTDLATTTPVLFATRLVTHVCAPVFVLLSGTAAYLYAQRATGPELRRFLATRGLFLVALELVVIRLGWIPDLGYHITVLQVIWAIGWSMLCLAALSWLPLSAITAVGAVMVLGHNLLDGVKPADFGSLSWLWTILHQPGQLTPSPGHNLFVSYPLIPWIGVMALGYGFGRVMVRPIEQRTRVCLALGWALLLGFVVLRAINGYGDPRPWEAQRSWLFTLMAFVNTQKYPPSLAYLAMTLGPALIFLAYAPRLASARWAQPLVTFGRVPLLFYVTHLFLLRYVSAPLGFMRFGEKAFGVPPAGTAGSPEYPLAITYLAWALCVLALYPLCRKYAAMKATRSSAWLRYL